MKWLNRTGGLSKFWIIGTTLLFLLVFFTEASSTAEEGFTMLLRPSTEAANPGDIVQLAVQVHNDGWPGVGEAEIAAFQATLDYDRSLLEFQSVEIPEGTMGDFRPDSGIVLGYGEGHVFQENYDCAVLTMKVSESASGDIPVTIHDAILATQNATELKVSPAGTLILKAGNVVSKDSSSVSKEDNGSAGAVKSAGSDTGVASAGSTVSDSSGSSGNNSESTKENTTSSGKSTAKKDTDHNSGSSQKKSKKDGETDVSSPENSVAASSVETTGADFSSADDGAEVDTSGEASNREQDVSRAGRWVLWGLLPVVM